MSQLRKRERDPEEGEASAVVVVVQNNGRLKLKVERGMAAPFIYKQSWQTIKAAHSCKLIAHREMTEGRWTTVPLWRD
jgi:hypothetical protein